MALIPYRPWWDIDNWFEDEEQELPALRLVKMPAAPKIDIYEKEDNIVVKAELPGFKPEQIKAEIKDNLLTIEAKTEEKKEEGGKDKKYWRREISSGYVKRMITLPEEVVSDKIEAEFKNGVLKIKAPKAQPQALEEKTKKLEIKS